MFKIKNYNGDIYKVYGIRTTFRYEYSVTEFLIFKDDKWEWIESGYTTPIKESE